MRFRGSTTSNDWDFGRGKQCYLTDDEAIAMNIATTLRTFAGECFYNDKFGVPWFDLVGQKQVEPLLLTLRQVIADCYGVVRVNELEVSMAEDREVVIRYSVSTIFTPSLNGTVAV
jgi:hypothetical protein